MATKFESFLKSKKIDPRRILAASEKLEKLRPEDRKIRLEQRQLRAKPEGAEKKEGERKKPRTGRPVTPRALAAALGGKPVAGPVKTRILRAINAILAQKKGEAVTLRDLFELPAKAK